MKEIQTQLREHVEGWLDDLGLPYQPYAADDARGYRWILQVGGQPFGMLVAERDLPFDQVFLQVTVNVSEPHLTLVRSLAERDRAMFLYDLRLALHGRPVGHTIEFEADESGGDTSVPVSVTLGLNLLEEPLTRAGFFRRNHVMQSAAQIVALMFQKLALRGNWP